MLHTPILYTKRSSSVLLTMPQDSGSQTMDCDPILVIMVYVHQGFDKLPLLVALMPNHNYTHIPWHLKHLTL